MTVITLMSPHIKLLSKAEVLATCFNDWEFAIEMLGDFYAHIYSLKLL